LLPLGTVTVKKTWCWEWHGPNRTTVLSPLGSLREYPSWAAASLKLGRRRLFSSLCQGDTSQLWGEGYPLRYLGGYTFCLWTWMVGFPRRFPAFQIFTHFTILPPRNSSPREYICKVPFQFSKGEKKEGEREYLQSHGCPKHVEYQTKIHLSRWGQSVDARPAGTYVCWVWLI
jgi:hypothetical protein